MFTKEELETISCALLNLKVDLKTKRQELMDKKLNEETIFSDEEADIYDMYGKTIDDANAIIKKINDKEE